MTFQKLVKMLELMKFSLYVHLIQDQDNPAHLDVPTSLLDKQRKLALANVNSE